MRKSTIYNILLLTLWFAGLSATIGLLLYNKWKEETLPQEETVVTRTLCKVAEGAAKDPKKVAKEQQ